MRYDLAIFDLDGTILDTLEDLADSLNYALEKYDCPVRTLKDVRAFVGNGIRKLVERAVPPESDESLIEEVTAAVNEHYKIHCADKTRPYDGIYPLLADLRKMGCRTALVSNKPDYGVQELCSQYFDGMFDIVIGERAGIRKKPDPDSVNEVLRILDIDRGKSVYIGDSEVDYDTAQNAGMDVILVTWGFRDKDDLEKLGASYIADKPDDILKIVSPSLREG